MTEVKSLFIVGGGHAGVEAAYAASRLGVHVTLVSMDLGAIARMSCNPAIGGLAKSHLVHEIDVLGGVMPIAADSCLLYTSPSPRDQRGSRMPSSA